MQGDYNISVGDIAIIVVFLVFFAVLCVWTYSDFIQKINKDINDIKELNLELSVFNHENAEQSFQEIDRIFNKNKTRLLKSFDKKKDKFGYWCDE